MDVIGQSASICRYGMDMNRDAFMHTHTHTQCAPGVPAGGRPVSQELLRLDATQLGRAARGGPGSRRCREGGGEVKDDG